MTNLEAIRNDLLPYEVRESLVERQCEKHKLSPDGVVSDEKIISICVIEILRQMKQLNSLSEGGVSSSFNKEDINALIRSKCKEHGLDPDLYLDEEDLEPTVTYLGDV